MDLSSLKDMDVKDLLSKLKGSQAIFSDKKMLTKFGIIFGAIVIFLIIYYGHFNKIFQDQKKPMIPKVAITPNGIEPHFKTGESSEER